MTYDKEWFQDRLKAYDQELRYMANVDTFLVGQCHLCKANILDAVGEPTDAEAALMHMVCEFGDMFAQTQEEMV